MIYNAINQFDPANINGDVGKDIVLLVSITVQIFSNKIIYFLKPGQGQQSSEIPSHESLSTFPKCKRYFLFYMI